MDVQSRVTLKRIGNSDVSLIENVTLYDYVTLTPFILSFKGLQGPM